MVNFFHWYQIPISINMDTSLLRKKYFELSKLHHPDSYAAQNLQNEEAAANTTIGFNILNNFDNRILHILQLSNVETENIQLPKEFLLEMMEINEQVMELDFDFDNTVFNNCKQASEKAFEALEQSIEHIKLMSKIELNDTENIEILKKYYFKKKYLLRIQEKLNTFANQIDKN